MVEAVDISKSYGDRLIIDKFNITIQKGDFIAVTGESGKGKTTLLNMLGLLESSDSGNISVEGILNPNRRQTMNIQRNLFGYIFQNYALIENETIAQNLHIAMEYRKNINKNEQIREALFNVNLEGFVNRKIYELSGGEQQRVALARLYVKECLYVFADEPTGNLDKRNRDIVFDILKRLNAIGKAVVYVTHDEGLACLADKRIEI